MRRFLALVVLAGLAGSLATGVILAQRNGSTPGQKGPPTYFDKSVENAFFKDVLRAHGPGTIDSLGTPRPKTPGSIDPKTPAGGVDSDWDKIVSAETLISEINSSINEVQPFLSNKSQWNTGHRKVRTIYNTLAVCFGVIGQYGGDVKFQKQAPTLRDALARSSANSKTNSDGAMKEAKTRHTELTDLRNGGSIPLNDEADPALPFGDSLTPLSEIMRRMSQAHEQEGKSLKAWTSSAAEFKANKAEIVHEAEIVAMLARVMQDKDYELAQEEGYLAIAKEVQDAGRQIVEAVKLDNLQMAQAAAGTITKACTQCHGEYRD